mmetsp:Transcript_10762/g.23493  ORF Transcript_10762/g.23493 Transcript_10762/m.23493 type:complete len:84 (-) Transcript_10762:254-505(-)
MIHVGIANKDARKEAVTARSHGVRGSDKLLYLRLPKQSWTLRLAMMRSEGSPPSEKQMHTQSPRLETTTDQKYKDMAPKGKKG